MKAIVENSVKIESFWTITEKQDVLSQFARILNTVTNSKNESDLRLLMGSRQGMYPDFEFGFGGHHMWVKQKNTGGIIGSQVIFVEF